MLARRGLLTSLLALPAIIKTPGLLMPVKPLRGVVYWRRYSASGVPEGEWTPVALNEHGAFNIVTDSSALWGAVDPGRSISLFPRSAPYSYIQVIDQLSNPTMTVCA